MIESMTGYGACTLDIDEVSISVEARSVNGRFLDLFLKVPQGLESYENDIRRLVKDECRRGSVSVVVSLDRNESNFNGNVKFDQEKFEVYLSLLETIYQKYGKKIGVENAFDLKELISIKKVTGVDKDDILKTVMSAIKELKTMRLREGEVIAEDLGKRIDHLTELLGEIEVISRNSLSEISDLYRNRIRDLLSETGFEIDENRILQETAILAERLDVSEEGVRCTSHLAQFKEFLKSNKPVGKRLNFLLQEIYRELNTIGSKTNQLDVTQRIVEMKYEVEKLKEQSQNIL